MIKKIFLPFLPVPLKTGKKGKKDSLLAPRPFFGGSGIVFSRLHLEAVKKNQVNLACPVGPVDRTGVNPVRNHVGFTYK